MNSINPRRFTHFNSNTFKRNGKKMIACQVLLPLERKTGGITSRRKNRGERGHGQQEFGRRYIESTRTKTSVYHATKGWRHA